MCIANKNKSVLVSLAQMAPQYDQDTFTKQMFDDNLTKSNNLVDRAARRCPDVVCFPEFSFTGPICLIKNIQDACDTIPGHITETLGKKAAQHNVYIVTNLLEKEKGKYFNTAVLIDPKGRVSLKYRKVHLYPTERYLDTGSDFHICETQFGACGLLVCYDIAFPEASRILKEKGAQIIFCPTMALDRTLALLKKCAQARAIENNIFLVIVNMVGHFSKSDENSTGKSFLVHPTGEITQFPKGEEVFWSRVNFKEIEHIKEYWSPFKDRRPEIYCDE
jgi:(R)-amidase